MPTSSDDYENNAYVEEKADGTVIRRHVDKVGRNLILLTNRDKYTDGYVHPARLSWIWPTFRTETSAMSFKLCQRLLCALFFPCWIYMEVASRMKTGAFYRCWCLVTFSYERLAMNRKDDRIGMIHKCILFRAMITISFVIIALFTCDITIQTMVLAMYIYKIFWRSSLQLSLSVRRVVLPEVGTSSAFFLAASATATALNFLNRS